MTNIKEAGMTEETNQGMTIQEFWNGKTISDQQRAHYPGEYNSTVAWVRRGMIGICTASFVTCSLVFAGALEEKQSSTETEVSEVTEPLLSNPVDTRDTLFLKPF